jgi:ABC-2 type transport system ATP-binding protein
VTEEAVAVTGVSKSFGSLKALDEVTLQVRTGEVYGLLGPNGSGKTTLIRMLVGLILPDSGSVTVLGTRMPNVAVLSRVGYMTQQAALYPDLSVEENVRFFAAVNDAEEGVEGALRFVELWDRRDSVIAELSGGMRQRASLACAIVHGPRLLLLDEPTVGLDPQASRDLRDRVRELRSQGRTILLTTHYMEEADQLCDRVAIIDHGKIVALDSPGALKRTIRAEEIVRLDIGVAGDGAAIVERLSRAGTVARSERHNGTLSLTVHCASARDLVPAAFDAAHAAGATVQHVEVVPVTLEDVFLSLTGRGLRE